MGIPALYETTQKNIVYPFDQYIAHWIIGYVYTRVATRKSSLKNI
ncbi:type II restriction endonuclease [Escherichia coli]